MSIASELDRLQTAKSDIADAITSKGTTVPGGTKMDGFASLIAEIDMGVSFPETPSAGDTPLFAKLALWTMTGATYTNVGYTITIHKNGVYRFNYAVVCPAGTASCYGRLVLNGTEVSGSEAVPTNNTTIFKTIDLTCTVGDIVNTQAKGSASTQSHIRGLIVSILAGDVQTEINGIITAAAV